MYTENDNIAGVGAFNFGYIGFDEHSGSAAGNMFWNLPELVQQITGPSPSHAFARTSGGGMIGVHFFWW